MKRIIIIITLFCAIRSEINAQEKIIYNLDTAVIDSLRDGIEYYKTAYHKSSAKELKLYALISDTRDGGIEIYLQEYSSLPPCGMLDLIKSTNRKINVGDNYYLIPVVIPADKLSAQMVKDKMGELPLSGFYIKVSYKNNRQSVVQTVILF